MIEKEEDPHRTTNFQLPTKSKPVSASFHHHGHLQSFDSQMICANGCSQKEERPSNM